MAPLFLSRASFGSKLTGSFSGICKLKYIRDTLAEQQNSERRSTETSDTDLRQIWSIFGQWVESGVSLSAREIDVLRAGWSTGASAILVIAPPYLSLARSVSPECDIYGFEKIYKKLCSPGAGITVAQGGSKFPRSSFTFE